MGIVIREAVLEKIGHAVIGRLARHGVIIRLDRFANQ